MVVMAYLKKKSFSNKQPNQAFKEILQRTKPNVNRRKEIMESEKSFWNDNNKKQKIEKS